MIYKFEVSGLGRSFCVDDHGIQIGHHTRVVHESLVPLAYEHLEFPRGIIREIGHGELERCAIGYFFRGHFWLDTSLQFDMQILEEIVAGRVTALSFAGLPGLEDVERGLRGRPLTEYEVIEVSLARKGADPLARIEKLREVR